MQPKVLNFPHDRQHVIQSLVETADTLESRYPEKCVIIQKEIISMLALECQRSTKAAHAAKLALESILHSSEQQKS